LNIAAEANFWWKTPTESVSSYWGVPGLFTNIQTGGMNIAGVKPVAMAGVTAPAPVILSG
jgi:hypothetical protein